jgi:hypothetical protein
LQQLSGTCTFASPHLVTILVHITFKNE